MGMYLFEILFINNQNSKIVVQIIADSLYEAECEVRNRFIVSEILTIKKM